MTKFSLLGVLLLNACSGNISEQQAFETKYVHDTIVKHDTVYIETSAYRDWQSGFGLTHNPEIDSVWGKPVNYYLTDPKFSPIAVDFYYGQMRPTDNGATSELLKLAYTNNRKLRPFYRWCLNKTIIIQDGALSEYTGVPARRYAEKFPKEFFEYMDADTSGYKYNDWVSSILYSGFYDTDDYKKPDMIRANFIKVMKSNCKDCSALLMKRIEKFGIDCFGKEIE